MHIAKLLVIFTLAKSSISFADTSPEIDTFFAFEQAYLSNSVALIEPWYIDEPDLSQTLHVGGGSDTIKAKKAQLLASISRSKSPNTTGASDPASVVIVEQSETGFCASGSKTRDVTVSGKLYSEEEKRTVCFVKSSGRHLVSKQSTDIYYTPK